MFPQPWNGQNSSSPSTALASTCRSFGKRSRGWLWTKSTSTSCIRCGDSGSSAASRRSSRRWGSRGARRRRASAASTRFGSGTHTTRAKTTPWTSSSSTTWKTSSTWSRSQSWRTKACGRSAWTAGSLRRIAFRIELASPRARFRKNLTERGELRSRRRGAVQPRRRTLHGQGRLAKVHDLLGDLVLGRRGKAHGGEQKRGLEASHLRSRSGRISVEIGTAGVLSRFAKQVRELVPQDRVVIGDQDLHRRLLGGAGR